MEVAWSGFQFARTIAASPMASWFETREAALLTEGPRPHPEQPADGRFEA
jgi:hypothetical protein